MMTDQEAFDHVYQSLVEQGEPSMYIEKKETSMGIATYKYCQYRMVKEDGKVLKCAAGHLIKDGNYSPDIESKVSYDVMRFIECENETLVHSMQRAHDSAALIKPDNFLVNLKAEFLAIADIRKLSSDVITKS